MRSLLRPAVLLLVVMTFGTGVVYPLVVTGLARLLFPRLSGGSVIELGGRRVGSELIGQPFDDPRYFWGRPPASPERPCDPSRSGGSNLDLNNPALTAAVAARVARLRAADPGNPAPVPVDLITASGSGLDPHISPAAAHYQAGRVARARGLTDDFVERMVAVKTENRALGVLGEPRVNVLMLNLALDAAQYGPGGAR